MRRRTTKCKYMTSANFLLCCALIVGSAFPTPCAAKVAGANDRVNKIIHKWLQSSNKPPEPSQEEIRRAIESGAPYLVPMHMGYVSQSAALRTAVEAILRKYDLTPSALDAYSPQFRCLAEKEKPYWQIVFFVDLQAHKLLHTISVEIDAVTGKVLCVQKGDDG